LFSAEYRYPVWSRMDAVFFVDTGQVFSAFDEVSARDFRTTFGGGFHLLGGNGLSARFEVARSVEGVEIILTVKPAFGRAPR
jgi:outer membrane protein assembly factor BamA